MIPSPARTFDNSAYINNLLLGARGARILQPAATPPSSCSFTKEMFTITVLCTERSHRLSVHGHLDPSGPCVQSRPGPMNQLALELV